MLDAILDTNHWIELKYSSEKRRKLRKSKRKHGFRILFTRPNFVDLAKRPEQDELSDIISEFADSFVAVDDYYGDGYIDSPSPLVLMRPDDRERLADDTVDFETKRTLRYLFRISDQDPDPDYEDISHMLREIHDEGSESLLEIATFWKYAERTGDEVSVDLGDAYKLGYVRRMLKAEHAKQLKSNENVDSQDYLDMEICAYAIYASDVFVGEDKWIEKRNIIPAVCDGLDGQDAPVLLHPLEELFDAFPIY